MIPAEFTPIDLSMSHEIEINISIKESWFNRFLNNLGLRKPQNKTKITIRPDMILFESDLTYKDISLDNIQLKPL